MTLDQLRYFRAVCRYNSVSRGAQMLNISQPSVSNAIANLEKEFGVELFVRQNKRLSLTKEGVVAAELAEKLLAQAGEMEQIMEKLSSGDKVLRLGIPPMIGSLVLPVLYSAHFNRYPQLQVQVAEGDSSALKRLLTEDQIDMAFLPHVQPFDSSFCSEPLTELQNVCCVHKEHPFADRKMIRLEELAGEPLVLFKHSFFQTERIEGEFARLGITPNVLLYTEQLSTVQNMVAGKAATGFIFEFLLKSTPELVGIPLEPPMTTQVSLVWRKSRGLTEPMRKLIAYIADGVERFSVE